ncbi:MAG: DUF721 domain-containing protein [Gammaproteobacteria bacterium]|nr:DUF721 domain-containing protein [Gammaproteobacteria bacterium]
MRQSAFRRLSSILDAGLDWRNDKLTQKSQISKLRETWREIISDPVAKHARPIHYDSGRLLIGADASVWASALRHQSRSILKSLHEHGYLEISELAIKVLPEESATPHTVTIAKTVMSRQTGHLLREAAQGIEDVDLKSTLKRLSRLSGSHD